MFNNRAPEPWHVSEINTKWGGQLVYDAKGILVADCNTIKRLTEDNKKNATLIAVAPELLMMLKIHHKNCVDTDIEYREGGQDVVAYRATAAVIAKAEGN